MASRPNQSAVPVVPARLTRRPAAAGSGPGLASAPALPLARARLALTLPALLVPLSPLVLLAALTWLAPVPALAQGQPVDDATLKREYDDYRASLEGMSRYGVHYIVVATEDEARQLINRLRIGGGDFATLARQHSLHQESAVKGGDLGAHATCRWARDTITMLDKLEPGQLNPVPVKASKGWSIYRLDSKEAIVPRSFERYREELLSGRFDPECPWQPPVSVGATPAVKRP